MIQKACKAAEEAIRQAGSADNFKRDVALARPNPAMVARVSEERMFGSEPLRAFAAEECTTLEPLICSPVDSGGGGVAPADFVRAGVLVRSPAPAPPASPRATGIRGFLERSQQQAPAWVPARPPEFAVCV